MKLRQEQVVFLVALLVLGLLSWSTFGKKDGGIRGRGRGGEVEFRHYGAPDVDLALPSDQFLPPLRREVFAPPRDTRPLPPLALIEPPRESLPALFPPTSPGPAPRAYGALLRVNFAAVDQPDLFLALEEGGLEGDDFAFVGSGDSEDEGEQLERGETSVRSLIREAVAVGSDEDPYADETPAERSGRYEGYKRAYDWIRFAAGDTQFGRIENHDRYGLKADTRRNAEPLLFSRLNPDTGERFFRNIEAPPIPVDRAGVVEFDFADTVANELEVRLLQLGPTLSRGSYPEALELGVYAVRRRLEAPRALEIAEELFRRASAFDAQDPIPRLGLAACLQAGFRFEEAFNEYGLLLDAFQHREEVHVEMAKLEERFLLFDQAEARYRKALTINRGSWLARWHLGRFLATQGEHDEALEHLLKARSNAPTGPDQQYLRVAIRMELADTFFAVARIEEAKNVYQQILENNDDNQRAAAGLLAVELKVAERAAVETEPAEEALDEDELAEVADEASGFELSLARGLDELLARRYSDARDHLLAATEADPLRAHEAFGALSFLAEATGNKPDAVRFAEEAIERDPTSAYALYQRGRLLGDQDDYTGARGSLLAALEQELDFEDALVALGEVAFRLGQFEDAERYLERAVGINAERGEVYTLRGLNYLQIDAVLQARESFQRALRKDPEDATAAAGQAWCTYLEGDVEQALIQLANIDDRRRLQPEEDPWRVWAREQMERIQDHAEKVEWTDNFNRARLVNGWQTREGDGVLASMNDGAVRLEGTFHTIGDARVYREYPAGIFVSLEADVWIEAGKGKVLSGIFVARERRSRNDTEIVAETSILRHKEGGLQVRYKRSGQPDEIVDMEQPFPAGQWVRLRIERTGEKSAPAITVYMDGIPLIENAPMASLGRSSTPLLVGLFAEGETGREVSLKMDNCSIVYRGNAR